MTDTNNQIRSVLLVVLMVFSVLGGTLAIAGTTGATSTTRDHSVVTNTPTTVFLGEEDVDISAAVGTSGSVTFSGVAGDADGKVVVTDDANAVDFTTSNGFIVGGYSSNPPDDDTDVEFSVRKPQVNDITLYAGPNDGGPDVTNGVVTRDTLTIEPEFNFGSADRVEVTITDSSGFDVTQQVFDDADLPATILKEDGNYFYTGDSGDAFTVDLSALSDGRYNVTMAGDELSSAKHTVSFSKGAVETELGLDKTDVIRGEDVIVTIAGIPGDTQYVRIAKDDLKTETTSSEAVFDNTGAVVSRATTTEYVYAEVGLGDSGRARIRINTIALSTGTITIETADSIEATEAADEVDLTVQEATITIEDAPAAVAVSDEFTITGTAPQVDNVRAFVKLDEYWYPIPGDDENGAAVDSNGTFKLDLLASDELVIPGEYRIGVVGYPDGATYDERPISTLSEIPADVWGDELSPTASTTLRTSEGNLMAELSRTEVATGVEDEVTLSGVAIGQTEVAVYIVKPRGTVVTTDISTDGNTFETELGGFDQRGAYRILVVGSGRDGVYDGTGTGPSQLAPTSDENTQQQNVDVILAYHDGAGVDDEISRVNLTASRPTITITSNAQLLQDTVTITGRSNRQPGTTLSVELTDEQGMSVATGQTEVTSDGTWNSTFNLSAVETGEYTLHVDGEAASATMDVNVVKEVISKTTTVTTMTTTMTTTATQTTTQTTTPTTTSTPEPTTATSTSTGAGPGFGLVVTVIALVGSVLLAVRRHH